MCWEYVIILTAPIVTTGKNAIIKWRGKPVFVRHRTAADIKDAESVDIKALRDPQAVRAPLQVKDSMLKRRQQDKDRIQKPEWLVMLGVCTHLVSLRDNRDAQSSYLFRVVCLLGSFINLRLFCFV